MVDGYKSENASPDVPIICIPVHVWQKTFDFSVFTCIQMAGGDQLDED